LQYTISWVNVIQLQQKLDNPLKLKYNVRIALETLIKCSKIIKHLKEMLQSDKEIVDSYDIFDMDEITRKE
jgi:hypothetical protein